MKIDDSHKAVFKASLERARSDPAFIERFYDRFINSSDQIRAIFHGQDVSRISYKLAATLKLLADSAEANPGIDMYLQLLGRVHSGFDITAPMFDGWRKALIETIRECDHEFDRRTENSWNHIIDHMLERMGQA